ncbi:DoxX-like protein [Nonlabens xylanidelens]|uniref:DoxX-like protein n=2 Tax=Nonlabens xylanidelens TaxID=191564 RepID=A0A2S6ILM2_9FLAO|nr:DoxX-like protein [Nonlabens xylanidelens]
MANPYICLNKEKSMKGLVTFCRWFVGVLFIFSGLIKLNDPLGFSYKLDEYFSAAVLGLEFLQPFALPLAIFLVIFEVILGIMLLIGFQRKFTIWSLLLMIGFFTFLTFYSAYFDKVTDCGCFGDAIPLVPWESFAKDVVLLVMILILFFNMDKWKSAFAKAKSSIIILVSTIICFIIAYYVLMHLPILDFRAYKVGTDIEVAMQEDPSQPDIYGYDWYYTVDGKEEIITTDGQVPEGRPGYDKVETRIIQEAALPKIHDFSIEKDGEDYTQEILDKEKVAFVMIYDVSKIEEGGMEKLASFTTRAQAAGYEVIGLSANGIEQLEPLMKSYDFSIPFYTTDGTQLKTAVRSTPAVMTIKKGVVTGKSHWNDFESLSL